MNETFIGNARGRAAPRRLTSRQSRAVEPPQAAIPELVAPRRRRRRLGTAAAREPRSSLPACRRETSPDSGAPLIDRLSLTTHTRAVRARGTIAPRTSAVKRNNDRIIFSGKRSKSVDSRSVPESYADPSPRRQRSRQQLLNAIRAQDGGITRSELSRVTGLSRSAIAEGVQDLLAERLVTEHRMESGLGRGRPSAVLVPAAARGEVAGIDFGHSHVSVAVAQSSGRVLAEHRRTIDVDHQATGALDTAAALLARCLADAHLAASDLISVAAVIPGPLDIRTGLVRSPTILSTWVDLDPARELTTRLGRPVQVGNDANMGALGELRFGAARGCRDFVYVKASHGIGAGLVLNGDTYRGPLGIAGEIGHSQLPDADNWCRCGNRGCLEAVVSISEVKRQLTHIS